jgi:hypothetical protein
VLSVAAGHARNITVEYHSVQPTAVAVFLLSTIAAVPYTSLALGIVELIVPLTTPLIRNLKDEPVLIISNS